MQSLLDQIHQLISSFLQFLQSSKKTILLVITVAVITLLISTTISILLTRIDNLHVPSLGNVRTQGVEAYWDTTLENKTETIDWGTLWLGSSKNATIYLLSISTIETTLNLTGANLTFYDTSDIAIYPPTAISIYMDLSWNYNGSIVPPGGVIQVTLTLSTDYSHDFVIYIIENNVKRFNLDILIRTIEYTT